jgi:protein involved in polysaccharide export with SLBB domain
MFRSILYCVLLSCPLVFQPLLAASKAVVEKEDYQIQKDDYQLQKDDLLKLIVYQEDDLSTETQIGKSGDVSFPLIGNVKVVGLTLKAAGSEIKKLYEKDYLVNAHVNLTVMSYAKKWVVIGGDVRQPGTIEYPEAGALDLRSAIAQAGGLLETANDHGITLRRKSGGSSTHSLSRSVGVILKHGDTVTVSRNAQSHSTVTVSGQVKTPGVVTFPKTGGMNIVTAIAQSGGFSKIAYRKTVAVTRDGRRTIVNYADIANGEAKMYSLRAGDLVIVKESRW